MEVSPHANAPPTEAPPAEPQRAPDDAPVAVLANTKTAPTEAALPAEAQIAPEVLPTVNAPPADASPAEPQTAPDAPGGWLFEGIGSRRLTARQARRGSPAVAAPAFIRWMMGKATPSSPMAKAAGTITR